MCRWTCSTIANAYTPLSIIPTTKLLFFFFFFSSRRRHTRCSRDWSSDVCSSDLRGGGLAHVHQEIDEVAHRGVIFRGRLQAFGDLGPLAAFPVVGVLALQRPQRSEERRVGKECRSRWAPYH